MRGLGGKLVSVAGSLLVVGLVAAAVAIGWKKGGASRFAG